MRTRPKSLTILSAFLATIAAALPVQIMILYGHPPSEIGAALAELAPLNWVIILFAPLTGWLVLRASRWALAALPALTLLVAYNNWLVGAAGTTYSMVTTILGTLGFLGILAHALSGDAVALFLHPERRWWLTPARRKVAVPVRIKLLARTIVRQNRESETEFYIRTFDLSETGAFIPIDQPASRVGASKSAPSLFSFGTTIQNLPPGTQCYLCMPLKGMSFIQCRAEIVRTAPARGQYPAGVGIRFLGLSWKERRRLTEFLEEAACNPRAAAA